MKELQSNKLDVLISASLYRNVSEKADSFMSRDTSNISDDPKLKKKILRMTRNNPQRTWKSSVKVALIACLIAMSVLFTACMCIPTVRESMWRALVEWYDDHIRVYFVPEENVVDTNEEGESILASVQTPPNVIEKRAKLSYLPAGYYGEDDRVTSFYADVFYYDESGNMMFRFMQTVMGQEDDVIIDSESDPVTDVFVNGNAGILVEYPDVPGLYYLVWQDKQYQYSLYGSFESKLELMKIAEGITLE